MGVNEEERIEAFKELIDTAIERAGGEEEFAKGLIEGSNKILERLDQELDNGRKLFYCSSCYAGHIITTENKYQITKQCPNCGEKTVHRIDRRYIVEEGEVKVDWSRYTNIDNLYLETVEDNRGTSKEADMQ